MPEPDSQKQHLDSLFPFTINMNLEGLASKKNSDPSHRIVFLKEGNMVYTSLTDRRQIRQPAVFIFHPGQRFLFTPLNPCQGGQLTYSPGFMDQLLLLCWRFDALRQFMKQSKAIDPAEQDRIWLLSDPQKVQVKELFDIINEEYRQRQSGFELLIAQTLLRLWVLLYRSRPQSGDTAPPMRQLDDLISYIQKNYAAEFSLQRMAEKYAISPGYLSRRFKERTGLPLFEYINTVRIQKACLLLKRTMEPVIEIAYAVGYNNLSFFNRYFRKIMCMSPREYRKQVQK